jgi:hypothetical protein
MGPRPFSVIVVVDQGRGAPHPRLCCQRFSTALADGGVPNGSAWSCGQLSMHQPVKHARQPVCPPAVASHEARRRPPRCRPGAKAVGAARRVGVVQDVVVYQHTALRHATRHGAGIDISGIAFFYAHGGSNAPSHSTELGYILGRSNLPHHRCYVTGFRRFGQEVQYNRGQKAVRRPLGKTVGCGARLRNLTHRLVANAARHRTRPLSRWLFISGLRRGTATLPQAANALTMVKYSGASWPTKSESPPHGIRDGPLGGALSRS